VEGVDRRANDHRRTGGPRGSGLKQWLAPFQEESPYPGIISGPERRIVADFGPRLLVILGVFLYAYYYGRLSLQKYDAFQQPGFDVGIFDQGIWLLSRFKDPFVTIMGLNLFGDHASYILLLFVPLYWIWPHVQLLFLGQTLALAVAAIPVYLIARRILHNSWLALLPALALLLNPALGWLNLENFHPDSFEVPLVLFALYFMTVRRWRPFMVMAALLLLVKEDAALLVVPLGIYIAFKHNRRVGFIMADVGVVWFVLTVFFLGPLISGDSAGSLDAFRIPFDGWKGLISTALTQPWEVLGYMVASQKIKYVIQLLAPLLFLPLFTVETLVVLPTILFNLLSTFAYQTNIRYHYSSLIIPVFAWAGLAYLRRVNDIGARRALVVMILFATVFSAYLWGPGDWSREPTTRYDLSSPDIQAIAEAVRLIPGDAVVACRSRISTHLAHRMQIYDFPTPFYADYYGDTSLERQRLPVADEVQYVLDLPGRLSDVGARVFLSLQENEDFRQIYSKNGVVLLQRVAAATPASASAGGG
jgi:uncharacterized membrane protein